MTDTGVASNVEAQRVGTETASPRVRPGVPFLPAIFLAAALLFLGVAAGTWWANRESSPSAVDIGFYDDMTTHHLQAIEMANIYERSGDVDDLRSRAEEIEFFQAGDIRKMQDALQDWNETGTPDIAMEWMGEPVAPDAQPGMATAAQLGELAAARGRELDDLFTRLMIDHHAGGAHMAGHAAETARLADTRKFAAAMARTQQREIDELNHLRVDLGLPVHEPAGF